MLKTEEHPKKQERATTKRRKNIYQLVNQKNFGERLDFVKPKYNSWSGRAVSNRNFIFFFIGKMCKETEKVIEALRQNSDSS